jgi:uncharacterized LabA/DUF88 family protein
MIITDFNSHDFIGEKSVGISWLHILYNVAFSLLFWQFPNCLLTFSGKGISLAYTSCCFGGRTRNRNLCVAVSAFYIYDLSTMRAYVYVDGFNLYYGSLKGTPNKWLDISKLCRFLFPHSEISKIKYFTAPVKIRPNDPDPDKPNRQQIYLRALKTIPNIEIFEGTFLWHRVFMKNAKNDGYTEVIKTEEKGTDVNIAAHLLNDGHKGQYEIAIVISNDSDLVAPIKMVIGELGLPVVVVSPFKTNSIELKKIASSVRTIRKGVLAVSQFSDELEDSTGIFTKPASW